MKTTIIELNGFAGSGKTTVVQEVIRQLQSKDFLIVDWKTVLDPSGKAGSWKQEFIKRFYKIPFSSLYLYTRLLLAAPPLNLRNIRQIPFTLLIEMRYGELLRDNQYDFVIMDQGLIQSLISIIHTGHVEKTAIFDKIACNSTLGNSRLKVINCMADEKTVAERVCTRKTMASRLDRIQDEQELLRVLVGQQREFENLRSAISKQKKQGIYQLDMREAPEENVMKLMQVIADIENK